MRPHQPSMSSSSQSTNSGPEPTFNQLRSGFDPSRSSNPCINKRQKHYQEYNNPLYFSCGSPGYHATDRIEVNISSSRPTSNTAEPFTATNTVGGVTQQVVTHVIDHTCDTFVPLPLMYNRPLHPLANS